MKTGRVLQHACHASALFTSPRTDWLCALHAGASFQVVHQPTIELKVKVQRQSDCWAAFPDRIALCISQGWFLPDGQQAWNVKQGRWDLWRPPAAQGPGAR